MLGGKMGRELTLRRALAKAPSDYEVILIDCPPSLGLLTVNALVAADRALVTAEAQYFALQGVEQAMEVVELARDSLNPELQLLGVLLNLADMRTVHSREALVVAEGALRRAGVRHRHPLLDRLRRVGRARDVDPRPPPRPRRRLPGAHRRSARAAAGAGGARGRAGETALRAPRRRRPAARTASRSNARPAVDLSAQRLDDGAGLLVEAPHEHRRSGARDRRARARRARGARRASS